MPGCYRTLQLPRFTQRTIDEVIRLRVIDEAFLGRIPAQRTTQLIADVAQMTDRGGAMAGLRGANRLLPAAQAFEPVLAMVRRRVDVELVGADRFLDDLRGRAFQLVA